jgi:DNA modification methylase
MKTRPERPTDINVVVTAQRARSFNALTAREWASMSRNVWNDLSSPREAHHLEHGAVFPIKLVQRLVQLYSRPGDWVLDPFDGVGSTVIGSVALGRNAVGIELNKRFHELASQWLDREHSLFATAIGELHNGDCRKILATLPDRKFQLLITSPPYSDFIRRSVEDRKRTHKTSIIKLDNNSRVKAYSDSPLDLGNLTYDRFLKDLGWILRECFRVTKPGGYHVWVVKDHRDTRNGIPYISFHSDLAFIASEAGFVLHDLIVWDQNEQRRLVLLGFPSVFYTNQNCSFLVVLRRPTSKPHE